MLLYLPTLIASTIQLNTYTYNPLVGITSETNPNGLSKYYEYDRFSRLILIQDHDNNILKKICYNYAGQVDYKDIRNIYKPEIERLVSKQLQLKQQNSNITEHITKAVKMLSNLPQYYAGAALPKKQKLFVRCIPKN